MIKIISDFYYDFRLWLELMLQTEEEKIETYRDVFYLNINLDLFDD